ncbi:MAG: hypothetical protein JRJ09_12795 [Deltaproteobacteria bacterium]|nr:hypothetical protein [Deltaproteobacteria bacterium]
MNRYRISIIAILVVGISLVHYLLELKYYHYHILYRELYYLPVILAGLWFGLRGGLTTSIGVTICFLPFIFLTWDGFSPNDFNRLMEIFLLYIVGLILGLFRDRERIALKKILKTERLTAIGRSLAGVAHDLKTPLIAIGGYTRLVQRNMKKDDPDYRKLDVVIHETRRLETMIREMLDFSRPLVLNCCQGDLRKTLEECLDIIEHQGEKCKVKVETRFTSHLPVLSFDDSRMKQCIINLLINAIQASPEGEAVIVRTSVKGGLVNVDITDRGKGILPEKEEEIFFPFFTTKTDGTGLGLPIAKKIAEAHGGDLQIKKSDVKGATFRVSLPV